MKRLFMILVLLGVVVSVTACNTIRGAGQDIEKVGDTIKDASH